MTFHVYYDTFGYYYTILSIISFRTITTLITLRYYYLLLWQMQNIMCIMAIISIVMIRIIAIIVMIYFCSYQLTKWYTGLDTRFNRGKHSYVHGPAIAAKILWTTYGVCTAFLADTPPKQASSTVFDPPQVSNSDAREQHIQPKVYICDALTEEPSGIGTAHPEQTIAWPKHGDASRSHGTFLHPSSRAATP